MTAGCRGQTGTFHGARYGNPRQPKGDAYCNKVWCYYYSTKDNASMNHMILCL